MTYFSNRIFFNEYFCTSTFAKPYIYLENERQMRNFTSSRFENGFNIHFERPLSSNVEGYFHIKNETQKISIAFNTYSIPNDPDDWIAHSKVHTLDINLFENINKC
jgi:hypothetical protein